MPIKIEIDDVIAALESMGDILVEPSGGPMSPLAATVVVLHPDTNWRWDNPIFRSITICHSSGRFEVITSPAILQNWTEENKPLTNKALPAAGVARALRKYRDDT